MYGKTIDQLIDALRVLPGVGVKSAQRMALQLLEKDRASAIKLSDAIQEAATKVGNCAQCRTLTEHDLSEGYARSRHWRCGIPWKSRL